MTSEERTNQPAIRIVIAEDQSLVRRGTAILLSMQADMEVVGQARNGIEAVELARVLHPDVVLMDLHMPLKGGVAATRRSPGRISLGMPIFMIERRLALGGARDPTGWLRNTGKRMRSHR